MTESESGISSSFASDRVAIGLCVVEAAFRYRWVNAAFGKLLGYSSEELVGRSFLDVTHPDDVELDKDLSTRSFEGEVSYFVARKRYVRKDGSVLLADLLATAVAGDGENAAFGLAVLTEASEGDPVTRRIEHLQRAAVIGQLSAGAAHDLRNSLGAVRLLADLVSEDIEDDRLKLLLDEVDNAHRITDSIVQHVALTKPSVDEQPLDALVASTEGLLDLVIPAGTVLSIAPVATDLFVKIESSEFRQVLLNLVLNARDATSKTGGTIRIETDLVPDDPTCVEVRVIDDGPGMTAVESGRAFEPFFTTKGEHGTGLGLTVSREIVERNGGALLATSNQGQGATFAIRLPLSDRQHAKVPSGG